MLESMGFEEFWRGRRVLVTGAGGFIGSHLVENLVRYGAVVRAFVRYNSRGDAGLLDLLPEQVRGEVKLHSGDLRDFQAVKAAAMDVEVIFHLGALIAIPYSYRHPVDVVETNILGTMNVLQAARECRVTRLVHTSTSEVYGTAKIVPIDEGHPLQGQSPYAASKIGADKLVESFFCSYRSPVVTVRPFNTFGPRQSARAVIPTIICQALTQDCIYLGNLKARRDFTYVIDTVNGFLRAGMTPCIEGQTFNLGVGEDISIGDLAQMIIEIIGRPVTLMNDTQRYRPDRSEVMRLISNNSLAKLHLGWFPQFTLEDGLRQTIDWIGSHLERFSPHEYQV